MAQSYTFQQENGLTADGLCGPGTFRHINAEIEALQEVERSGWITDSSDVIWWQDTPIKIDWPSDKVHTFKDAGFPYPISKGVTKNSRKRTIKSFVCWVGIWFVDWVGYFVFKY